MREYDERWRPNFHCWHFCSTLPALTYLPSTKTHTFIQICYAFNNFPAKCVKQIHSVNLWPSSWHLVSCFAVLYTYVAYYYPHRSFIAIIFISMAAWNIIQKQEVSNSFCSFDFCPSASEETLQIWVNTLWESTPNLVLDLDYRQVYDSDSLAVLTVQHTIYAWWRDHNLGHFRGTHYNYVIMSAMASQITSLAIVYSIVYSRCRSKKTWKILVTGLYAGNSSVNWNTYV